jgi:preprotein translocase subunit YajC
MWDWRNIVTLLADDVQEAADAAGNPANGQGPNMFELLIYVVMPVMVVFMLINAMLGGPERKEKARRQQLLNSLKKNDQVVTIGGIFGTVVSVSDDKSAVTIRVDDNASTKIKFRLDAIREVVSRPGEETSTEKS